MSITIDDGYLPMTKYDPDEISTEISIDIGEEYDQKTLEVAKREILKVAKKYLAKAHLAYLKGGVK